MKESTNSSKEDINFNDSVESLKTNIDSEKDQKRRSVLFAKLWNEYYRKGSNYFDQGDYKAALQQHIKAFEFNDYVEQEGVFNLFMSVGIEYEKIGEYDQAINHYKELLDFKCVEKDDRILLLQFIGQCFDKKGEERSAYDYFKELFSNSRYYDGEWYLVYRYAKLAYKYREFDTSVDNFNTALEIIPVSEKGYIQSSLQCLGYIHLEKEAYKVAVKLFKKALRIKTGLDKKADAEILSGMAQAYFGRNKFAKAIKYSKKAIEKPHGYKISERSYFLMAFCYGVKKDKQKEQYYVEKLKRLNPNSPYLKDLI